MKKLPFLLFLILFCQPSFSEVNMKNGSYTEKWIDIIHPGSGFDFKIERHYSSRSLFIGLFGFGWCSRLETNLAINSNGSLTLTECGGGVEVTYYPTTFDTKSKNHTIDKIIKKYKSSKNKMSPSYLRKLRTQLAQDHKQRFEIANKLHLVNAKKIRKKKGLFISASKGIENIKFDGKEYYRTLNNKKIEKFNNKGQLVQIIDPVGNWVKFTYKSTNLAFLADNKGRRLNFSYGKNGKLKNIQNGRGLSVQYSFNSENLISVTNAWKNTYSYKYDSNHNLVQASFPDKSFFKMSYNYQNDWIKSYTDRVGCTEKFDFILSRDDPKNHYWSSLNKVCKKKTITTNRFEFWYKKYSHSAEKYLHRLLSQMNQKMKDMYFHPYFGKPIAVHEDQNYIGTSYLANGFKNQEELKSYSEKRILIDWNRITYKYRKNSSLVDSTTLENLSVAGKKLLSTSTKYTYNKRNLLVRASRGPSTYVNVNYNSRGQISSLVNNKNTKIILNYDNIHPKPVLIKQNGLGEVQISYDSNEEVIGVKSSKGKNRKLASSVIQSFLGFLEIIGPGSSIAKF